MERQRYYKLDFPIKKNADGKNIMEDILNFIDKRIKPEYRKYVKNQFKNGIEYVCVSDAFTHIERLTFPAFKIEKRMSYLTLNICGRNTFYIDGGNPSAVYDDKVYIRKLRMANRNK